MSIDLFIPLKSESLFLPTPLLETPSSHTSTPSTTQIHDLLATTLSPTQSSLRESYRQFIHVSEISKSLILNLELVQKKDVQHLYQLWEIRLSSLLFANELSIAQSEAKRLTIVFQDLLPKLHQLLPKSNTGHAAESKAGETITNETEETKKDQQADELFTIPYKHSNFPNEVPFSLRFLIIRLRSIGPGKLINEEYYSQLWYIRHLFDNHPEFKDVSKRVVKVIYWGLSSSLIAKREYFTFLSNTDILLNGYGKGEDADTSSELELKFKNKVLFLSTLINLIIGESDTASTQFSSITSEQLESIIVQLETLLNSVNPVLDRKNSTAQESTEKPDSEKIDLHSKQLTIDDLFELVKNQLITGRILCSLCASFELELRDVKATDEFNNVDGLDNAYKEIHSLLFQIWKEKTYKLHAYE